MKNTGSGLSRREFLTTAVGAGGAMLLGPGRLNAAADVVDPRFAQVVSGTIAIDMHNHVYPVGTGPHPQRGQPQPQEEQQQADLSLAEELKLVVVASLFERRAAGLYHNTAIVFDRSSAIAGKYRKMHIPDDPAFYEKFYFTPGDLGFTPIATSVGKLGVLVCWDQWYPEAARLTALQGAEILFYPTAIGWHPAEKAEFGAAQSSAWETIQRSHAIANGLYVAAVNRIGHEGPPGGGLEFWGGSFLADPFGRVIARAGIDVEELAYAWRDLEAPLVRRKLATED